MFLYLPAVSQLFDILMHFTIWTEKRPNKGEDAPPTLLIDQNRLQGMLAVYDGLGGAGSKVYEYTNEAGEIMQHSGAFLASRLAKQVTEEVFAQVKEEMSAKGVFTKALKEKLMVVFTEHIGELDKNPSKLKSKLIKRLPTTLAGLHYKAETDKRLTVNSFWAGDSRCYMLTVNGLRQLSTDDLNGAPDALENLLTDATISNCISADGGYKLNRSKVSIQEPVILMVATDGCFGYVKSPAHFEFLLLKTLMNSQYDVEDWKERLEETMGAIAGDDLSMSVLMLGMKTLEEWKIYFYERYRYIQAHFVRPIEEADANMELLQKQEGFLPIEIEKLHEQKRALREELWEAYKVNYYLQVAQE